MYTIDVEKRDSAIKAKKLRKNGIVPCSISDGKSKETQLIQISEGSAKKLLKEKGKGGNVLIHCEDQTYNVIIKEIEHNQLNNQIETITFQCLNENEYVNSTARVVLINRDKVPTLVQQSVEEIPYCALAQDLIEEIVIDLAKMSSGSTLKIKDLCIWTNKKIKVRMNEENLVLHVS